MKRVAENYLVVFSILLLIILSSEIIAILWELDAQKKTTSDKRCPTKAT